MYDNICKFIAEEFTEDIATWLLGSPATLTQLSPKELSLEPIRADSLILLTSQELVLHLEFQTEPDEKIPFRMIDYRLRTYRRFPDKEMRQVVIYLKPSGSDLVYQNYFRLSRTNHEFDIIRLWEQPTERFLNSLGLLPFAVLSQTNDKRGVLTQVAQVIESIPQKQIKSNIAACAEILAGLVLEKQIIVSILREEIMRESVIYQDILQQGIERGIEQGIERVALNMLREGLEAEQVTKLTNLSLERVQSLKKLVQDEQNN